MVVVMLERARKRAREIEREGERKNGVNHLNKGSNW